MSLPVMFRSLVVGVSALSMVVLGAGCSSEVTTGDDVEDPENVDSAAQGYTIGMDCTGASDAAHIRGTRLFAYVLGNDSLTFPTSTACSTTKNALLQMRAKIASGEYDIQSTKGVTVRTGWGTTTTYAPDMVCGSPAAIFHRAPPFATMNTKGSFDPVIATLNANIDACFGVGTRVFFMPESYWVTEGWTSFKLDPEPATLTANLGSTTGATAAAYYTDSGVPVTVKKFGTTYTSCGTAEAGEPCSPVALAAGKVTGRVIQKTGTLCRCL